jgi:molybdenum cofactor biosynthesis protein MoaC
MAAKRRRTPSRCAIRSRSPTWTWTSRRAADGFAIEARVRTEAKTGAEMEALHAVAVAALTLYDMVKAADPHMVIGDIRLVKKTGGRSDIVRKVRSE